MSLLRKRTYTERIDGNYIRNVQEEIIYQPVKRIKYDYIKKQRHTKTVLKKSQLKMTSFEKGERLELHVFHTLKKNGFEGVQSRPGPDNGLDIICGYKEIRINVQVKNQQKSISAPEINKFIGVCSKHVKETQAKYHLGVYIATSFTEPAQNTATNSQYLILLCTRDNFIKNILTAVQEIEKQDELHRLRKRKQTAVFATDYEKVTPTQTKKAKTYTKYTNYQ
jgi:predicted Mrr-cat superfamily restriction endonuclease